MNKSFDGKLELNDKKKQKEIESWESGLIQWS